MNKWRYHRREDKAMASRQASQIPTGKPGGNKIVVQATINHNSGGHVVPGKPPSGKYPGKPTSPTDQMKPSGGRGMYEKPLSPRGGSDQSMIPRAGERSGTGRPMSPKSDRATMSKSSHGTKTAGVAPLAAAEQPRTPETPTLTRQGSLSSMTAVPMDQSQGASGDKPRVTLGEILRTIEEKMTRLLRCDNFTEPDVESDLTYIATQTRYSADLQIKRKIISKIVELNAVFLFIKVFRSVHRVDYLTPLREGTPDNSVIKEGVMTNGTSAGPTSAPGGATCLPHIRDKDDDEMSIRDDISVASSSASKITKHRAKATPSMTNLKLVTKILWNTSDKSPALCEECIRQGIIQMLLTDLSDPRLAVTEMREHHRLYLVRGYLGIMHNICRYCSESREICREHGAVKILQQYLKSSWLTLKTTTLMVLSYIINESENDIINATDKHLVYIVKILEAAVHAENHFAKRYGYWAVEIAAGLNRLASNDANKERIVQKGALPLYTMLLQHTCTEEEQLIAAQGVWILAFSDDSRRRIREENGCVDALVALERTSQREEIRKASRGALWLIQERNARPQSAIASAKDIKNTGHIMVSYQWSAKPLMLQIRDRLRAAGYKIWMDVDNMSGSTLESMAEAVERAAVVLICMSQKYKDSPSCRTEAEYSYRLRKDIVPLRVQHRYNPDGWLGIMIGTKLFFDFTRSDSFEMMMSNLIRELGSRGRMRGAEYSDSTQVVQPILHAPIAAAVPASVTVKPQVSRWKADDVKKFLSDNGLSDVTDKFKDVDGDLLLEVKKMLRTAPESFYSNMKELGLPFITTLKLTKALDKLDG